MTYLFGETCTSNASRKRFFQIGVVCLKNHDLTARFFPTLTIVTACRGQYKSDLADISTCHAGMSQFLPRTKKDCGRRDCHGDSLRREECKSCYAGGFKKIMRSASIPQHLVACTGGRKYSLKFVLQ